ncbi:MAG TPA: type I secretion system permease/ATPase, partial [Gammaproteobacteria bacterium]|nr:type I secretion system permease/ATPase [Gammaproteobacteria bacterium]
MPEEAIKNNNINRVSGEIGDSHDDPLLDCLELVARLQGRPTTRTALRSGLPLVDNRLTVELFSRAANRAGLSARVVRRPLQSISNLELPAVLLMKSGSGCVLVTVDEKNASLKVLLPEAGMGEQIFTIEEFDELYSGYTIFIRPQFRPDHQVLSDIQEKPDSWFWGTLFASWPIYRDVLVASFLINLFGLASPFFILNVYDRVVPNAAFETLWVLGTGIAVIYIFELIMRGLRGYFIDIAGKKAELQLSSMLFEKVMGLRMEARPKSVGAFSKNLQEFDSVREFIT